jgi:NAD(P)H-flavin reductase/predicted pyridoxine 5'-phosphate oxidase superfamily flavin-nucleotide-binding protein
MSFVHEDSLGWHSGNQKMYSLMHAPSRENPSSPFLTPGGAYLLQSAPLLALGTLDADGNPWTTLWGGEPGFSRSLENSIIVIKQLVDRAHDPVVHALLGEQQDGEIVDGQGKEQWISGLAINLQARKRVKLAGRWVGGAIIQNGSTGEETSEVAEIQMAMKVDSSLGNCPKYLNRKTIIPANASPVLVSDVLPFSPQALQLLSKADLFFITSSTVGPHMSTNHRGGPPGFVRVISNTPDSTTLAYPEYSGNRLYQTLGNLQMSPRAGCVFPDFETGDVLYMTANAEILAGKDAASILPHSNLVVLLHIQKARYVQQGLTFRGQKGERSPYNPSVRYLASERPLPMAGDSKITARFLKRETLTPNIARFRFHIDHPSAFEPPKPGQYVALSFEDELSAGYSHMRDDDPKSLNDDYIRTFTVSSPVQAGCARDEEFEITIRNVGVVTNFLFRQNPRAGLEIPIKGFAGDFQIKQPDGEIVPFVAGGIGITPLLGQVLFLDLLRVRLFWTINLRDIGLVIDTFERSPALAATATLFVSGAEMEGSDEQTKVLENIEGLGSKVVKRRIKEEDIKKVVNLSDRWYICMGPALKADILNWLTGKEVVYESFDY